MKKINEVLLLQKIIKCICDAIGSQVSVKKISDTLISSGRKVSVNTVEQYVRILCDSFIFYKVPRFDIRGRQVLKTLEKSWCSRNGSEPQGDKQTLCATNQKCLLYALQQL